MRRPCRTCGQPFEVKAKSRYCSAACRCGTDAGYNSGCGCDRCKAAHARNHKRLRIIPNPAVPTLGTARRIQALACLGWSTAELSRRLGMHRSYLLKTLDRDTVEAMTALAVRRLYDELSMTWCTTLAASRTAAEARARGWAPPLAWDERAIDDPDAQPHGRTSTSGVDEIVVERLLAGHRVPSTRAEKVEALRRWMARGRSQRSFCALHGWAENRYVERQDGAA